ncbi:SpoIIE family protein phosphatase [bacterium]|nr:SpoIIE family protein phosphatase [bacterium]
MISTENLGSLFENEFVKDLFRSLGEGIIIADQNDAVIYMNPQAEAILRCRFHEMKGKLIYDCHRCQYKINDLIANRHPTNPYRSELSLGENRWVSVSATPINSSEGKRIGSAMLVSDTSLRRQMEKTILAQRDELKERQSDLNFQLNLARQIQKAFFPPESIEAQGLNVRSWNHQALSVGGDFYFVRPMEKGTWIILGDVMGKGLSASMFVPLLNSFISEATSASGAPREVLRQLNKWLFEFTEDRVTLFSTMIAVYWNPELKEFSISLAGHPAPCLFLADRTVSFSERSTPPLGIAFSVCYGEDRQKVSKGDRLILVSDGILDLGTKPFPKKQFYEFYNMVPEISRPGEDLFNDLKQWLESEIKEKKPNDDLTLVVIEVM